jgi:hypothetical protein
LRISRGKKCQKLQIFWGVKNSEVAKFLVDKKKFVNLAAKNFQSFEIFSKTEKFYVAKKQI